MKKHPNHFTIYTLLFSLLVIGGSLLPNFTASYSQTPSPDENKSGNKWLVTKIGIIGASSLDLLEHSIARVEDEKYTGLVLQLDTPGGALNITREMVKILLNFDKPIIVWVGPGGAHAGSAGAFITMAGLVAVMAEGTNIGAAHPVTSTGQNIGGNDKKEQESSDARQKIINDTASFIESIATKRGRNVELAISFVKNSLSITSDEALKENIIDLQANSIEGIFEALESSEKTFSIKDKPVSFRSEDLIVHYYQPSLRQKLLEILSDPNLFYLFFMAGLIGLGFELTHPGSIFPGVIGGICLILALIATSVLPISFGAAALILAGIGMLIAEAFVPSFGILGIGGFVAFVLGSIFLVDPQNAQGMRISWYAIIPSSLAIGGLGIGAGYLILKAQRSKPQSQFSVQEGQACEAVDDFKGNAGLVRYNGEIWQAIADNEGIKEGDKLKIKSIQGLKIMVTS